MEVGSGEVQKSGGSPEVWRSGECRRAEQSSPEVYWRYRGKMEVGIEMEGLEVRSCHGGHRGDGSDGV